MSRVASIKMGSRGHAKITSLVSDMDGGMLYAGSSDGKIQVRSYNSKHTNEMTVGINMGITDFPSTHSFSFGF